MWKGFTLEREIVGKPNVILIPTLDKNEKVEHHIRKTTHKSIVVMFWFESGINILCELNSYFIIEFS